MTEQITTPDAPAPSAEDREAVGQAIFGTAIGLVLTVEQIDALTDSVMDVLAAARQPAPVGPDLAAIATTLGATTGWSRADALAVLRALAGSAPVDVETGVGLIATERGRQVEVEGYTPEHDAGRHRALSWAATCYALDATDRRNHLGDGSPEPAPPVLWPWPSRLWKPTPDDRVHELVKAGALVAAAIDSLLAKGATHG